MGKRKKTKLFYCEGHTKIEIFLGNKGKTEEI